MFRGIVVGVVTIASFRQATYTSHPLELDLRDMLPTTVNIAWASFKSITRP